MVLKNFVHYLINKYLKNYIERLDYEKLNFSLKNGHVLLENLRLKPESLAYLNIPATVAVGYIERLQLTIPWKSLTNKPTEVHIDGLYLLIVSKNEHRQDLTEHYGDKMARVEEKVKKLRATASENRRFHSTDSALLERMRLQIKQNLIFKIRNLHVRYERKSPDKLGHPFSFGITLHYLELTTVTNVRTKQRIRGNILLNYMIREINSLAFYWNTDCKSRQNASFDDVLKDLKSKIATNNYIPNTEDINYILRPVNLYTEILITLKPKEHHYERSTLLFDIQVPQIDFHVDTKQISDVLDFIKFQNYTTIHDRCREYRELFWKDTIDRTNLSQYEKQRIQFLETKLDVFHLAYIRHKVEIEMSVFSPEIQENNQTQLIEIDQRSASITTSQNTNNDHRGRHRWNPLGKVKNKFHHLNKVLDHLKTATSTVFLPYEREFLFEDLPKFDVELVINEVNLNILSPTTNMNLLNMGTNDEMIGCLKINDIRLNLKRMCISSRVECIIDFYSTKIFGIGHNKQHELPIILEMYSSSCPNVHMEFELFPMDQMSDYRFHMIIQPMKFVYDTPTINRFVESIQGNPLLTNRSPQPIKRRTSIEMELNCPRKKIFDMQIKLNSVSILLPQYGVYQRDFSIVHIRFGQFMLKSSISDNQNNNEDSLFQKKPTERQFYNKYKLELTDLRIRYTEPNKMKFHILRRIPLIDMNFYKCKFSDDETLVKWRIALKTTIGQNYLSKAILTNLIDHFNSIPLLYSNLINIIKRINFYLAIFSPETTVLMQFSIYNSFFRLLMHSQRSIRTDLHIQMLKTRDNLGTYVNAMIILNEIMMINHIFSQLKRTSQTFYHRKKPLKLIYSKTSLNFD